MCTAATFQSESFYFGRNFDWNESYQEKITITPRKYPFVFRCLPEISQHYAMIGMATIIDDYPLYYEATNEAGLSMAGLSFPGLAYYQPLVKGRDNVAPFELIPWILCQCATVEQAREKLEKLNLVALEFNGGVPLSPLHWIISHKEGSLTVEPIASGLMISENQLGILTNNPTFDYHMTNLVHYMSLSPEPAVDRFSDKITLKPYSHGLGAVGMPGDLSSASRFVKASFTKLNSHCMPSEMGSVSQMFHILQSVEQPRGCVQTEDGKYQLTIYSSCCNADKGIYYYTTYENRQISAVDMYRENIAGNTLMTYPMLWEQNIFWQN